MKVILKGPTSCAWHLDGTFICGGVERDLTAKQVKEAEASNLIEEYIDKKPSVKAKTSKKYTEKELFDMNKTEQVAILEKLGLKPARKESERVKQILEDQND